MKTIRHSTCSWIAAATLSALLLLPAKAVELITNGGFESGFAGWTRVDQLGSVGTFFVQTGLFSPALAYSVPPPPQGTFAAMTDAAGPGSHVLYQDFFVPTSDAFTLNFSLFTGNQAQVYYVPSTLDFATPALNQQARVDVISTSANPFSVAAGDILENVFQTNPGDPLPNGYTNFSIDLTTLLTAHQGETLRLRFAEVDNVNTFNLGVDNVSLNARSSSTVPEALPWLAQAVSVVGVLILGSVFRRRSVNPAAMN